MTDFERYIKKCDLSLKDDVVITYDNVQALGKFIALLAIKRVMHYQNSSPCALARLRFITMSPR